jgi:hypothetical protein
MKSHQQLRALSATLLGAALCTGALAADSLSVVRDATTGELRAPTAEEAQALAAPALTGRAASAKAAVQPLVRSHANGATSVRLTDEFATYAVGVRKANGSVQTQCFDSKDAATAAVSMASPAAPTTAQAANK